MTKAQLTLALARFPDHLDLAVRVDNRLLPLDHVEMTVDSAPQTITPSGGDESWQQLLVNRIKVTLVGEPQAKPMVEKDGRTGG